MPFPLSPIMIGVLAAALPAVLPIAAHGAELGQVDVSDPQGATHITLDPGSTVTYTGTGSAINVSNSGNLIEGDGLRITAGGVGTARALGVKASLGGAAHLTHGSVSTIGTQQSSHALYATGVGSAISGSDMQVSTAALSSNGAYAQAGGHISLQGGAVATAGNVSHGVYAEGAGSVITAQSLDIRTTGANSMAVSVSNGGRAALTDVRASNASGTGMSADGAGSALDLLNTTVSASSGTGIYVRGASLSMQGGSVTSSGDSVMLAPAWGIKGATATLRDTALFASNGYGVNINAQGASATLDGVSIFALGPRGTGVWLPSIDTLLDARNVDIASWTVGIDNRAGRATLQDGSVVTYGDNAHGLYVSREYGTAASIAATGTRIETSGAGAVGALARLSGASVSLTNASVDTDGTTAYGLFASGSGSSLTASGSTVATRGAGASALAMSNRASVTLDATRLTTSGLNAHGVWSYGTAAGVTNNLFLVDGTHVDTQDGVGLLASGGDHHFTLSDATITARTAGDVGSGDLLQSRAVNVTSGGVTTAIQTGRVNLDATRSTLTGDIIADSGAVDIALSDHSVLTGALVSRNGRIDSLSIDGGSTWNVRGNSALGALGNGGTIALAPPSAQSGFKTLTVRDYTGGGTLVMNTQLGGDGSPSDRLVIDGGTTTGLTGMRIINAGGVGALTQQGIKLVETINGGTTTPDAFRLDPGSSGYRPSTGTMAVNGYDYSLVRGGNQGVAPDWYLTSAYNPATLTPIQPIKPGAPGSGAEPLAPPSDPAAPLVPADPTSPNEPHIVNVSPESGAYIGNQLAATRLFMHDLDDRGNAEVLSRPQAGGHKRDRVWVRAQGGRQHGLRMTEGDVRVDADSGMVQLGGDLVSAPLGKDGRVVAGVMAGYGQARVRSTAGLALPGQPDAIDVNARGRVTGYAAGAYATAYANDATRMGAYADAWMQYGRYSNQISSELGATRYRSNTLTVSVETGYAFAPFASTSALASMVVVPKVQLAYIRYGAKDAVLPTMRLEGATSEQVNTRAGVRIYPLGMTEAGAPVQPFVETNWLHASGTSRVKIGASAFDALPARDAAELKVGAQGRVGKNSAVSGHVSGQWGGAGQRGVGGMLNFTYRW